MEQIILNLRKEDAQIFNKYVLWHILKTGDAGAIKPNPEIKKILLEELKTAFNEKNLSFYTTKKLKEQLINKLKIDKEKEWRCYTFHITLDAQEMELLQNYIQWHIVSTEETYIKPGTMIRRLMFRYIDKFFNQNGINIFANSDKIG